LDFPSKRLAAAKRALKWCCANKVQGMSALSIREIWNWPTTFVDISNGMNANWIMVGNDKFERFVEAKHNNEMIDHRRLIDLEGATVSSSEELMIFVCPESRSTMMCAPQAAAFALLSARWARMKNGSLSY
jgi:hypothetical protein